MQEQFVTYEIAKTLKELGFNEPCLAYYTTGNPVTIDKDGNPTNFVLLSAKLRGELVGHGSVKNELFKWLKDNDRTSGELYTLSESITAPLWQQVIDWLRIAHKVDIQILRNKPDYNEYKVEIYKLSDNNTYFHMFIKDGDYITWFSSYEEAREQAILKAIELCSQIK